MTSEGQPQEQFETLLASLQKTPYDAVDSALAAQLKAVDDWAQRVGDQPQLGAMASVLRAQIEAAQRVLDVQRREGENVAKAMREAARGFTSPAG